MKWYVKEFSALTKVSVPTLHHYDDINLLKPSLRLSNGYRLYSESDLLKLERIIALKFFGFSLQKIKELIGKDEEILNHLGLQIGLLDEQIKHLQEARQMAQSIVSAINKHTTIDWNQVALLIKVYQMTKELSKTWAGKVYTEEQLKQLTEAIHKQSQQYSEAEIAAFRLQWDEVFKQAEANLDKDPASPIGKKLGLLYILLMKTLENAYKDYPELWKAMSKAYEQGKLPEEVIPKKPREWLEKAAKILQSK